MFRRMLGRLTRSDAPTIFRIAGFDTQKSQWISGLNNIFYMVYPALLSYVRIAMLTTSCSSLPSFACLLSTVAVGDGRYTGAPSAKELQCSLQAECLA
jgi:hypothetical protein